MSKKENGDRYILGHQWAEIIFVAVALCIVTFLLQNGIQPNLPWNRVSVWHFLLVFGLMLAICRRYVLDFSGFSVTFFKIPVKKLAWSQIGDVILVRKRMNGPAGNTEGVLLIIPTSCAPFRIGEDKVDAYAAKHPFEVYSINVPPKKADEYAVAFQKYYGKLIDLTEHL